MKTYELMAVYKTVHKIEEEIKEAQGYLKEVDEYYGRPQGRYSPTKQEYDYIKRMVDDGQPVVLTKKMKKALKIKDEMETLEVAMKEDLKEAGIKKSEIAQMEEQEIEPSDEDSVERRKRKAIKEAKKAAGLTIPKDVIKRVTKKEKARKAYLAERERQKILRPKSALETPWQHQQRVISQSTRMTRSGRVGNKPKNVLGGYSNYSSGIIHASSNTCNTTKFVPEANLDIGCGPDAEYTKKSTAIIEVTKLPKYYSSKLITRNQSGVNLNQDDSNIDL